jgi:hypothetical protein
MDQPVLGILRDARRQRILAVAAACAVAYAGSYLVLRQLWSERWERDGRVYMIFPKSAAALYYAYRPLSYADAALTGMRFHIGPHA